MNDFKDTIVDISSSLHEAISQLDKSAIKIALIVDADGRLRGTLTDGDVRRGLLKGFSLSSPVQKIMCNRPFVARPDWSQEKILSSMQMNGLHHLPIVDYSGVVIGLETLNMKYNQEKVSSSVCIMAGGFGKRLLPLTHDCPKPMLKIGNKPLLELILCSLIDCGFYKFYISTHFNHEKIQSYFQDGGKWHVQINYIHEPTPLGTGGALGLLPKNEIYEPLLVVNGDILTNINYRNLIQYHSSEHAVATICAQVHEYEIPFGVLCFDRDELVSIMEKPRFHHLVNAGIYVLNPEVLELIERNKPMNMPDIFSKLISNQSKISVYPLHENWLDIGRHDDYALAQTIY